MGISQTPLFGDSMDPESEWMEMRDGWEAIINRMSWYFPSCCVPCKMQISNNMLRMSIEWVTWHGERSMLCGQETKTCDKIMMLLIDLFVYQQHRSIGSVFSYHQRLVFWTHLGKWYAKDRFPFRRRWRGFVYANTDYYKPSFTK